MSSRMSCEKALTAPARRELVRQLIDRGLSERRSLRFVEMSASAFRYVPRPDGNGELRKRIQALAQSHKRYGVGMIYLKLRQAGMTVNYKHVERLYQEAKLQVRRRKRVPVGDLHSRRASARRLCKATGNSANLTLDSKPTRY